MSIKVHKFSLALYRNDKSIPIDNITITVRKALLISSSFRKSILRRQSEEFIIHKRQIKGT